MSTLKVIVVANETESRVAAKHLLEHEELAISAYVECKTDSYLKINGVYPDVVLFVDEGNALLYELARRIYVSMPGVLLVLAASTKESMATICSVESGFHLVVPVSLTAEELYPRLERLSATEKKRLTDNQRRNTNAKIISVYSAKGGCGKTLTAVNLALLLTQRKKKTLLLDASFHFGDVTLYLDMTPKDTIAELVQEGSNISIDTINSFTALHSSGLNVLAAPKTPESAEYVTQEHLEKLLSLLRPHYDYIMIDLPVTLNDITLAAVENSDTVLYLVTPDIAGLKNMYQVQKVMQSLQQNNKFQTVINRAGAGNLSLKEMKKNCAFPLAGTLCDDEKSVFASIGKGTPLAAMTRKNRLTTDLKALCDKLCQGAS